MFRKMKRTIMVMTCVIAMEAFNVVPVFACTPPLNPPSVKIPDINFQPDGALEDAINNAVKNWLEKCVLATPVVKYASYYKSVSRYFHYSHVAVKWTKVENATSYKTNYTDEFFADGMDGATVSVKAYGDNDTFGCWSDDTNITSLDIRRVEEQ